MKLKNLVILDLRPQEGKNRISRLRNFLEQYGGPPFLTLD